MKLTKPEHGEFDVSAATYTDDEYYEAAERQIDQNTDALTEMLDSIHTIGSSEWCSQIADLYRRMDEWAHDEVLDQAQQRYIDKIRGY